MSTRAIWEALSIGKVSQLLDTSDLFWTGIVGMCFIFIHFIVAIGHNYIYDYGRKEHFRIWHSSYALLYVPLLLLSSSLEFLIVIQCSVLESTFWLSFIAFVIYEVVKGIHMAAKEETVSILGITEFVQELGYKMSKDKKWFFQDTILNIVASYKIKRKQKQALK